MSEPESKYPHWKTTTAVPVDAATLRTAEQQIASCEACTPDPAEVPFEHVLDCLTGCDPESTDYVLTEPARCPNCWAELHTGYWRWCTSEEEGGKVFILPGSLVALKEE
jgi:hypothetical protein